MKPKIPDLTAELWALVLQIPRGKVASYGDIARVLGDVVASRHVGHAMMHHRHTTGCPCHRLVRMDGTLGQFVTGNPLDKARALEAEGIEVSGGRTDLPRYRYDGLTCAHPPLMLLAEYQQAMAKRACAEISRSRIERLGGVDVSYVPKTNMAVAAFVEIDLPACEIAYQQTLSQPVVFPYVPSYLAFRELPILQELLSLVRQLRSLPDAILVDGSGMLHPRRAGIATMLGVSCDVCTIGVTKKHLAGRVDVEDFPPRGFREVYLDDHVQGFAVLPGSGTNKPLYISPGFGIDVATSLSVVQQVLCGRRLPEPIYWADRLSRQAARRSANAFVG